MREKKREFLRINLNKGRGGLFEGLRGVEAGALLSALSTNFLPLLFLAGILLLIVSVVFYFFLLREVENLRAKVEEEKRKREALISQIRRLEAQKRRLELLSSVYEFVDRYNDEFFRAFSEAHKLREGFILQNISICSFRGKNCDINEALKRGSVRLSSPVVQLDFIALTHDELRV
ncbi:MAG: hypothetical protein GXO04_00990, partial [Aquificae bacterium]|nr:hypothetical protein [Aquificota bacterium]